MLKADFVKVVKSTLKKAEINYGFIRDKGIFHFAWESEDKLLDGIKIIIVPEREIGRYANFYAIYPQKAICCITEMEEFLTRANYSLPLGNFELDLIDGEIRFKMSIYPESDQIPSEGKIIGTIYGVYKMYERYAKGIMAIINEELNPDEAIALCERHDNDD